MFALVYAMTLNYTRRIGENLIEVVMQEHQV